MFVCLHARILQVDVFEILAGAAVLCSASPASGSTTSGSSSGSSSGSGVGGNEAKLQLLFEIFDFDQAGILEVAAV
jgi:hypothetical protein